MHMNLVHREYFMIYLFMARVNNSRRLYFFLLFFKVLLDIICIHIMSSDPV